MSEFAGSTPIGGVKVIVEADTGPYDRTIAQLRQSNATVGSTRVAVPAGGNRAGPQWSPGNAWPQNGPTPTQRRAQATAQAAPTAYQAGTVAGGTVGGAGAGPTWAPGNGGATPAPGAQPAQPARPGAGGNRFGITMGHNILSVYALAHAAEGILQVGTAAMEAAKNLRVATNDAQRIKSMLQGREAMESGASRIPLAGSLGVAIRNAFDSMSGNSREEIERNQQEASDTREYYDLTSHQSASNRLQAARNNASGHFAGSSAADKAVMDRELDIRNLGRSSRRQDASDKYNPGEMPQLRSAAMAADEYDGDYREKKQQYDMIKIRQDHAKKLIDDEQALDKQSNETAKKKMDFEDNSLKFSINNQEDVARLITQHKFVQADIAKRWQEYVAELRGTKDGLLMDVKNARAQQGHAEETEYVTQVGRTTAANFDVRNDLIGDPLDIRHVIGHLQAIRENTKKIEQSDPFVVGRQ